MEYIVLKNEELVRLAVEQGQIPRYLYKYCTFDIALKIVGNHSVHFSTYDLFNDPFDCAMRIDPNFSKDDWETYLRTQGVDSAGIEGIVKDLAEHPEKGAEIIRKSIEDTKKNIGILCLSDRPDNLLLWAHYADQHHGVCLEFDVLADSAAFCIPKKVSYDDAFPVINYLRDQSSVVDALSHKSKDWQVEGEYRVIKHNVTGLQDVKPEALSKVILGMKCDDNNIDTMLQALKRNNYPNTQLCQAHRSDKEYKVLFNKLSFN